VEQEPVRAEDIDWVDRWRAIVETRRQRVEALAGVNAGTGFWDRRADQFRRLTEQSEWRDAARARLLATA